MTSETQTVVPAPAEPAPPATTQASLAARLGAEAFGTFALVLAIVGVALYLQFTNAGIVLPVALAGGLIVASLAAAIGHVSGGHYNPAVTLGVTLAGRARWADVLPYWVAQLVGGIVAAGALFITLPEHLASTMKAANLIPDDSSHAIFAGTANGFGTHSPIHASFASFVAQSGGTAPGSTLIQAILVEAIVTAVFVGIIIAVTDKRTNSILAPVSIGLALFVGIAVSAPLTNASLNPARSTASAVFAADSLGDIFTGHGVAGQLWVFWVGPLLGAAIAGLFYLAFAAPKPEPTVEDVVAEALANGDGVVVVEETVVTEVDAVIVAAPTTDDVPAEELVAAPEAAAPVEAAPVEAAPVEAPDVDDVTRTRSTTADAPEVPLDEPATGDELPDARTDGPADGTTR
ncbi:MIP/aquaporin family protein [Luteimicrobium subarcticum]|uniref:Aquaporin Z n=1 Tax=Luteimicrobium subarcticum TaxID=620910 RepID=A0A2M8WV52_9MICO|nr:aquaporin [Luteimicrobium subarcticum]PJI94802.1 aquaporin Z [Luteimicrobium subarcticum]